MSNSELTATDLQVAEKGPSTLLPSSLVFAAYYYVRLIPQDFGPLVSGPF
jgi:hypothetical protein